MRETEARIRATLCEVVEHGIDLDEVAHNIALTVVAARRAFQPKGHLIDAEMTRVREEMARARETRAQARRSD